MMNRYSVAAFACAIAVAVSAFADEAANPAQPYVPRLGDIMGATQLRHFKLWYAGKEKNWPLAGYELDQIKDSFQDAMTYFPGLPAADMSVLAGPAAEIGAAIKAKDSAKFTASFRAMTNACNSCHQSQGYGFIRITVPTASPFSNEIFAPPPR